MDSSLREKQFLDQLKLKFYDFDQGFQDSFCNFLHWQLLLAKTLHRITETGPYHARIIPV